MADDNDIVTRLRDYDRHCSDTDIDEAADEIEQLRAKVADLEQQLADSDAECTRLEERLDGYCRS